MPKFKIHFMGPIMTWDDVEAEDEEDAIDQCGRLPGPKSVDLAQGPYSWHVERADEGPIEEDLCEFFPVAGDIDTGGVCGAGSELSDKVICTMEYSKTCEHAKERRG